MKTKPRSSDAISMMKKYNTFILQYTYKKEDLLFKVLFDKIQRPKIYQCSCDFNQYKHPNLPEDLSKKKQLLKGWLLEIDSAKNDSLQRGQVDNY